MKSIPENIWSWVWNVNTKLYFFQDQLDFGRISKVFEKMKSIVR